MFCRNCGNQINDHVLFCNHCGTQIPRAKELVTDIAKLPFREELKKSKFLLVLSIVCLFYWLYNLIVGSRYHMHYDISVIFNVIFQLSTAFFWGAFTYAATKRSVYFTFLFSIPYGIYYIGFPFLGMWVFNTAFEDIFDAEWVELFFGYFGNIVLPFFALLLLRWMNCSLLSKKQKWLRNLASAFLIIFLLIGYEVLSTAAMHSEVFSEVFTELILVRLIYYSVGVAISRGVIYLVYKGQ